MPGEVKMNFHELWSKKSFDASKLLVNGKKEFTGTAYEFFEANFEIVEEKKTLSDKIRKTNCVDPNWYNLKVCDVQEAIKEFIDSLCREPVGETEYSRLGTTKIAKEIFGKRLI